MNENSIAGKHTPGPWKLCYDGQIEGADGSAVLRFNWDSYKEFNDRTDVERANARLIAAAPDLLAALRDVISWVPGQQAWHTCAPVQAVERARAAIAKATGVQP